MGNTAAVAAVFGPGEAGVTLPALADALMLLRTTEVLPTREV